MRAFAAHVMTIERDLHTAAEITVMQGAHVIRERVQDAIGHADNGLSGRH